MRVQALLGLLGLCVLACTTSAKRNSVEHTRWTTQRRFPRSLGGLNVSTDLMDIYDALVRLENVVVTSSRATTSTLGVPLSWVHDILTKFTSYSSLHYIQTEAEIDRFQRKSSEQLSISIDAINVTLTNEMNRTITEFEVLVNHSTKKLQMDVENFVNRAAREVVREQERQRQEITEQLSRTQRDTAEINSTLKHGMNDMKYEVQTLVNSTASQVRTDIKDFVNRTARDIIREQERKRQEITEQLSRMQIGTAEINSTFTFGMSRMKQEVEALVNGSTSQLKTDVEDFFNRTVREIIRGQDLQKEEHSDRLSGVKSDIAQISSTFNSEMSRMKAEMELLVNSVARQVKTDMQEFVTRTVRDITRGQDTLRQEIADQLSRVQENIAEINSTLTNGMNNMKVDMEDVLRGTTSELVREQERHRQENSEQTSRLRNYIAEINSTLTRGIVYMKSEVVVAVNSVAREVRGDVKGFINSTAGLIIREQDRHGRENAKQLSRMRADIEEINSTFTAGVTGVKEEIEVLVKGIARETQTEIEDFANRTVREILRGQELQRQGSLEQFSRVQNDITRFNSTYSLKLDAVQSEIQAHISRAQQSMTQQLPQFVTRIAGLNSTVLTMNRQLDSLADSANSGRALMSQLGVKVANLSNSVAVLGNNVSSSLLNNAIKSQVIDGKLDSVTTSLVTIKSTADTLLANCRSSQTTDQLEQRMLQTLSNTSGRIDQLLLGMDGAISSINNVSSLVDSKLDVLITRFCSVLNCLPIEGGLRLVGGSILTQGRLEIFHAGRWGTICDDDFETIDAQVACSSLGMPYSNVQVYNSAHFGQGSDPIWLDNVRCSGTSSFLECGHNGWGIHNCGHGEDVGVSCA